jgi:hypothetical protein
MRKDIEDMIVKNLSNLEDTLYKKTKKIESMADTAVEKYLEGMS